MAKTSTNTTKKQAITDKELKTPWKFNKQHKFLLGCFLFEFGFSKIQKYFVDYNL